MTWLASRLDRRIDICKPVQTPLEDGSFERDYEIVLTIWAEVLPLKPTSYIRGKQTDETITHKFVVRKIATEQLFNSSDGNSLNPIKTNYFIFLRQQTEAKGRRFAIKTIIDYEEKREYCEIFAEEIEEDGN